MHRFWISSIVFLVLCAAVAGCSTSDGSTGDASLSPAAARGLQVAKDEGCVSCHSPDGRKGVGPTWQGLYGSTVTFSDGTEVTADEQYLTAAIDDPGADIVDGYSGIMPEKDLDEAQVADVVAYIRSLAE